MRILNYGVVYKF